MVSSLELTEAVGACGAPVKIGLTALTTSPVPVVEISSIKPAPALTLPKILLDALTF